MGCAASVATSKLAAANPNAPDGALGEGTQAAPPPKQQELADAAKAQAPSEMKDPHSKRPPSPKQTQPTQTTSSPATEAGPETADKCADTNQPPDNAPIKAHVSIPLNDTEDGDQKPAGRLRFEAVELVQPAAPFKAKAEPSKSLLKTSSYVGSSLLLLAKKHPQLGPISYSLGVVVCNAVSARSLRLDSARLALVLKQV